MKLLPVAPANKDPVNDVPKLSILNCHNYSTVTTGADGILLGAATPLPGRD
jgi:hypothetical protein